jgi:protein-tyrosine kinase
MQLIVSPSYGNRGIKSMTRIYEALETVGLGQEPGHGDAQEAVPVQMPSPEQEVVPLDPDVLRPEEIRRHKWQPSADTLVSLARRGAGVEQFRQLRSRLSGCRDEAPTKTILISSGLPEEGKTFVTANLALSLGRNGEKNILLIDGDLRRPRLHDLLGAPNTPGLGDYLAGSCGVTEIMQRDTSFKSAGTGIATGISNLTFLPAGECGDNASELAANHRMEQLIKCVSLHFDWILIDASPVLVVTDAVDLARAADAVLLVARAGVTKYEEAQRTQSAFSNTRVLGIVLNAARGVPQSSYYYSY